MRQFRPLNAVRIAIGACLLSCVALAADNADAAKDLAAHLAAVKDTQNFHARFLCEKNMAALETPLQSKGELWIRRGDPREGDGAVRFSTEEPYHSELILANGKVSVRSQHEAQWTTTNQSSRPGTTAVMSQLAGWSTGDPGKVTESYAVSRATDPLPDSPRALPKNLDTFALTPTNKDLAKVIKKVTLAIDPASHHLLYIEIRTLQDDTTRYWFLDIETNLKLPADIFTSAASPATSPARP